MSAANSTPSPILRVFRLASGTNSYVVQYGEHWLDLACGNGIIGAWLATRHPSSFVVSMSPG